MQLIASDPKKLASAGCKPTSPSVKKQCCIALLPVLSSETRRSSQSIRYAQAGIDHSVKSVGTHHNQTFSRVDDIISSRAKNQVQNWACNLTDRGCSKNISIRAGQARLSLMEYLQSQSGSQAQVYRPGCKCQARSNMAATDAVAPY